jgi:hypothetical protein
MKRQFINALLCGVMIFPTVTYTSCSYDDDDLKSRLTVVEGAIGELKEQLSSALTTGASIVEATETNGTWTIKLSNGKEIKIVPGAGSGSEITVTDEGSKMVITVNGTAYEIPKGGSVNSLIYSPEYADGIVHLGNDGALVKFLATPVVSADALKNATFDIAEDHELKTRAGNGFFNVRGEVTLEGDFIVVPVKGLNVQAGKMYAVSVLMNLSGTSISSNYFTIKVADDFSFNPEEIGGYELKNDYNPIHLEGNFEQITVSGLSLLNSPNSGSRAAAITSFKDLFSQLPEKAEFVIASRDKQPGGSAQEKRDILSKNLSSDGTWTFNERLGTSFNDNAERPGFLFNVVADDVVKAKVYVVINDELANLDFVGVFNTQAEAEWGGREKFLPLGAQEIDIQSIFANYETEIPIIHGGKDEFFGNWTEYAVTLKDRGDVISNDGERLVLGDVGKAYMNDGKSRGLYWFNHGFAVYVPEALATEDGKYVDENGKKYDGGEGYGYDFWGRGVGEEAPWNVVVTQDGIVKIPETYTGYGLRLGLGAAYEYAYGEKRLSAADQMGLIFFNRRLVPEGATMPAPKE